MAGQIMGVNKSSLSYDLQTHRFNNSSVVLKDCTSVIKLVRL